MNIGIMTFHVAHNYGALVQAYSLRSCLTSLGHDAHFVNYAPEELRDVYSPRLRGGLLHPRTLLRSLRSNYLRRRQAHLFENFIAEELGNRGVPDLGKSNLAAALGGCDAVVVGSDQVWNTGITGGDPTYFLPFDIPAMKVAYAASFGRSPLGELEFAYAKDYLPSFDVVSVRETPAAEALRDLGVDARVAVDPVMLRGSAEWREFGRVPPSMASAPPKYLLLYALSPCPGIFRAAERESRRLGIPVVCVHPLCASFGGCPGTMLRDVGPREFVWLVDNAAETFTNSFHCSAFSLLFGKRLWYADNGDLGSRVRSLLELSETEVLHMGDGVELVDFSKQSEAPRLGSAIKESRALLSGLASPERMGETI